MLYFLVKFLASGLLIAAVSEFARRSPQLGALVLSLPLVAILSMIWLWRDTGDAGRIADFAQSTFWYVLPTLPMFLALPMLLRAGFGFWPSLGAACALTVALYLLTVHILARFGISL